MNVKQILIFAAMVVAVMAANALMGRFTGWTVERVFARALPSTAAAPAAQGTV